MKRRQTGFAHLALLILLVVAAVVAFAGYKVVKNHQDQTAANKTSTAVIESAGTIKSAADLDSAAATLNNESVDSDLNPSQLDSDVNSVL
jgi:Tfp pilus assembly protein PilX